ncbi:MAG TPA: DoxX family protein [Bryobacteraceae bacterium]|nr:DoxX family protein [Bryobacteraceae bacterium]
MALSLLRTQPSLAPTLLRLPLGAVFFAHGCQKTLGLFGGSGLNATISVFVHGMHIPPVFAYLAVAAEFLGGLGLILGFFTRIATLGICANMAAAIYKVHLPNGLFMNWGGNQKGEGIEFHLLAIGMCLALMILGAGSFSVDNALSGASPSRARRR